MLAQQALPIEFRLWNGIELPLMPRIETQFVDVVFLVDGFEFFCHKPIFSTRSEYFRALLADHFDECQMDGQYDIPVVQICLLYTSPSPRDATLSRMPSSA